MGEKGLCPLIWYRAPLPSFVVGGSGFLLKALLTQDLQADQW